MDKLKSYFRERTPAYSSLPDSDDGNVPDGSRRVPITWRDETTRRRLKLLSIIMIAMSFAGLVFMLFLKTVGGATDNAPPEKCDTPERGFQCSANISHSWGQYSPFYSVPSEIDPALPKDCELTFALILSRHGARDPTFGKAVQYAALLTKIQGSVTNYGPGFEFLRDYEYTLGADQLTAFGEQQMVNSGIKFYQRYQFLAKKSLPFVRASGQNRVLVSAKNWTQGFHEALRADETATAPHDKLLPILEISEDEGVNNTLSHGLCKAFERGGRYAEVGSSAQERYLSAFAKPITSRLNERLPGANITDSDVISLMDLCPFNTVASPVGALSKFCGLFSQDEWEKYDYYQTLGKYYGYGPGNPLGPTQGVGWVNELIARLLKKPVEDSTSSNGTLDSDPVTFPLDRELYADFSHDNDMMGILGALGVYDEVKPLDNTTRTKPEEAGGFSAAWTVAFAARIYVEKMVCRQGDNRGKELVRILVNDKVVPLTKCPVDEGGRCEVEDWVKGLKFVREGGRWVECFA
ncbi:histidine phosphatase superfamily [Podospora australis]|uniref:Phytase A n=1 Tax=Podospora australis TaxID=1536484 RepID=A0AAN6X287_9PEZI|nr:histidine phosphatase superfamily [Podospora australis]